MRVLKFSSMFSIFTGVVEHVVSADVTGGLEQNEKFVYEKKYRTVSMR